MAEKSKVKIILARVFGWLLFPSSSLLAIIMFFLAIERDMPTNRRVEAIIATVIFAAVAFWGFMLLRFAVKHGKRSLPSAVSRATRAKKPTKGEPDMMTAPYAWYEAEQAKAKKENSTYADREGQKPKPEIERHAEKKGQERIEELANLILYYQGSYHNGEAEITDTEFDILWDELKSLAPNHPVIEEIAGPTRKTRK